METPILRWRKTRLSATQEQWSLELDDPTFYVYLPPDRPVAPDRVELPGHRPLAKVWKMGGQWETVVYGKALGCEGYRKYPTLHSAMKWVARNACKAHDIGTHTTFLPVVE